MEVQAKLCEGERGPWSEDALPGEFKYYSSQKTDEPIGLIFMCPCGCGHTAGVMFNCAANLDHHGPRWNWNGNRENPSITPSIRRIGGCEWHGYLTNGVFRSC